ncbi:MAG: transcription termination factor NusA, partial [Planctomycetota bacterium]
CQQIGGLAAERHRELAPPGVRCFNAVDTEDFSCEIDRLNGEINVFRGEEYIELSELGRIPAQTAKQVMIQRFREDERASIFDEYIDRVGELVTGMAQRYEGGALVVQIGRAEGFMPRSEQIPGEQHQPGERVRCLILDVRDAGNQVKIVLSRGDPKLIQRLFEVEVPEVAERIIEIRAMAREPGHRTKLAVASVDSKVDAVGACVGVRGSRIKNIVDELGGEKIDIVRWNDSSQLLIQNALKPAEVVEISLCFELGRATVVVNDDQLSLAIGKRGQNVRLAARLTNWDVDILTPPEFTKSLDIMEETLKAIDDISEEQVDRLAALGLISVFDVEEVGPEYLGETLGVDEVKALEIIGVASEKGKEVAEQQAIDKAEAEARKKEEFKAQQKELAASGGGAIDDLLGGAAADAPRPAPADGMADGGGSIIDMLEARDEPVAPTDDPAVAGSDTHDVLETEAAQQGEAGEALADETPADAGTVAGEETDPA